MAKVSGIRASVGSQLQGVGGGADPHPLGRTGWAAVPQGGSEKRAPALRPLRGSLEGKDVTARGQHCVLQKVLVRLWGKRCHECCPRVRKAAWASVSSVALQGERTPTCPKRGPRGKPE